MKLNEKAQIVKGKAAHTCMFVSAHQDDIEIACPMGVMDCYKKEDKGLVAVIVTDGGGSPRAGRFADYTYDRMVAARAKEQAEAARIGDYSDLIMLFYTSAETKDKTNTAPVDDIYNILMEYQPEVLYTHNLADKHETHVAVVLKTIAAVRRMSKELRPKKMYGCEGWRDLDWMPDDEKVLFDVSGSEEVMTAALRAHVSQVEGGKSYDGAVVGRRVSNATFSQSHSVDTAEAIAIAMDLTPLIENDDMDIKQFVVDKIEKFKNSLYI